MTCNRCGRNNHTSNFCKAFTHINGQNLTNVSNIKNINTPPSQYNQQANRTKEPQNKNMQVKTLGLFYEEDPTEFAQSQ